MAGYLNQHPEIFVSTGWRKKEPYYFGSDFANHKWRISDPEGYLAIFTAATNEKYVGEASPWYLYSERAAREIHQYDPGAKIIAMVRNPVDMMYSLHRQFLFTTNEDIPDFIAALAAESDRKVGRRIPATSYFPQGLLYREVARFARQLRRYFDVFGRENAHVIVFDDMKADVAAVYRDTLAFLGVDAGFKATLKVRNPAKTVRSRFVQRFLFHPPSIFKSAYRRIPARIREPLGRPMLDLLKSINVRSGYSEKMSDGLRTELQREFLPDVEELGELLGRNLSHWCGNAARDTVAHGA